MQWKKRVRMEKGTFTALPKLAPEGAKRNKMRNKIKYTLINIIILIPWIGITVVGCTYREKSEDIIANEIHVEKDIILDSNELISVFTSHAYRNIFDYLDNNIHVDRWGWVYIGTDIKENSNIIYFIFGLNACEYYFPIMEKENKIEIIWNPVSNCDYDIGFSKCTCKFKKPKKGDIFAVLQRTSEGIQLDYIYPEFIECVNQQGRKNDYSIDTLFPRIFRCTTCEGK